MNPFKQLMRIVGVIVLICLGLFLAISFLYALSPFGGYDLLFVEFIGGFWFFLRDNLPAMSFDAGTWGPGLGAFLLAVVFAHRFLKAWAARTNRYWSFATSFSLALVVPVLFVISFIVPGVLVQWEMLRQVVWLEVN
ncbi:MAG: hypothetical protein V4819_09215 [Verrucomicrobiota bacterium]